VHAFEGAVSGDNERWRLRTIQDQIARISRIIQSLLAMARPGRLRRVPIDVARSSTTRAIEVLKSDRTGTVFRLLLPAA
jgi:hypothetical protein